jgi:hypothetical protein
MKDSRSYKEKLRDGRWQLLKGQAMQRDGWACCECHRPASCGITLNVHHRFYQRGCSNPWDYSLDWLETLCEDCHEKREQAILLFHASFLNASTGELIIWAKRVAKELRTPKRKLEKQAKANKPKALTPPIVFIQPGDKTVWDQMRAAANGLVALQEMRNAE